MSEIRKYAFTVDGIWYTGALSFFHFDIRNSVFAGDVFQIQSGFRLHFLLPTILHGMITQRPKQTTGARCTILADYQIRSTEQDFRCQQATSIRCINRGNTVSGWKYRSPPSGLRRTEARAGEHSSESPCGSGGGGGRHRGSAVWFPDSSCHAVPPLDIKNGPNGCKYR